MADVNLGIGIGAEYKGRPAFKKADKDILGLQAGVKSLAKAYIGLAGAQKAFRYATASVKAFAQDDAAIRTLSKTLDNLGLAYEQTNVENFIAGLESTFHVADDLLRPAFAKLVQVTQSYTKSKELLTVALNASAGAGVNLTTTVSDLSQAYVGNLKGLKKYNLGLTNAELATMSYQQIVELLNKTFSGQASLAADSYAKKLDALTIASGNAQEIIGKGLVDAISTAFGGGDIEKATKNIEAMAGGVAEIVRGLGDVARLSGFSLLSNVFGALADKRNALATKDRKFDPRTGNMPDLTPAGLKIIAQRKKADADAVKRQKELAALTLKQTKALKEQTALQKAKALLDQSSMVMNMDLIQNTAALMGKVTDDEALRLQLQQAILLGNSTEAGNLAQQLLASQIASVKLAATNPVNGWSKYLSDALAALRQLRDELDKLGALKVTVPITPVITPLTTTTNLATYVDAILQGPGAQNAFTNAIASVSSYTPSANPSNGTPGTTFPGAATLAELAAASNVSNLPATVDLSNYVDAIFRPGGLGSGASEIRISIDPSAAAFGVSAAVVANAANGNSNTFRRNGMGF
jgi:hypothetical protein